MLGERGTALEKESLDKHLGAFIICDVENTVSVVLLGEEVGQLCRKGVH